MINVIYYLVTIEKKVELILTTSRKIILKAATECFFQHGYTAANISMIGRYAKISRVTIHKQFKSKEDLFRVVVEKYIAESNILLEQYSQACGDFWGETEAFTLSRCGELFEEISSAIVRTDLYNAGQSYCQDIIQENEFKARRSIAARITKEIEANRLTLKNIDMSVEELALIIESTPLGMVLSSLYEDDYVYVSHLMKIFKAATSV